MGHYLWDRYYINLVIIIIKFTQIKYFINSYLVFGQLDHNNQMIIFSLNTFKSKTKFMSTVIKLNWSKSWEFCTLSLK
jgi:hypothetical protein